MHTHKQQYANRHHRRNFFEVADIWEVFSEMLLKKSENEHYLWRNFKMLFFISSFVFTLIAFSSYMYIHRAATREGGSGGIPPNEFQSSFFIIFYSEKLIFFGQNSKFFAPAAPIGTAGMLFFLSKFDISIEKFIISPKKSKIYSLFLLLCPPNQKFSYKFCSLCPPPKPKSWLRPCKQFLLTWSIAQSLIRPGRASNLNNIYCCVLGQVSKDRKTSNFFQISRVETDRYVYQALLQFIWTMNFYMNDHFLYEQSNFYMNNHFFSRKIP